MSPRFSNALKLTAMFLLGLVIGGVAVGAFSFWVWNRTILSSMSRIHLQGVFASRVHYFLSQGDNENAEKLLLREIDDTIDVLEHLEEAGRLRHDQISRDSLQQLIEYRSRTTEHSTPEPSPVPPEGKTTNSEGQSP